MILRYIFCLNIILLCSFNANAQCPKSHAWICGRLSGGFTKIVFQNQDKINADRFCSGVKLKTQIDSFSVKIIRDTTVIFQFKNIGNMFANDFMSVIKTIEINDKVIFFNICGTDYDGSKVCLDPLEYFITED